MSSKNVLLVGAGSSIALETATRLESEGATVQRWTRSSELPGATVVENYHEAELPELPEVLHGLVYYPGTLGLTQFHRIKPEKFLADLQINTLGFVHVVQHALPALEKADGASVVAITTVAVQTGLAYHASIALSKGGLEALVRTLAAEYAAKQVRFNAIAPSLTDTNLTTSLLNSDEKRARMNERHALGRVGTVADIAAAIRFLLSDDSAWMTGDVLAVDGGFGNTRP